MESKEIPSQPGSGHVLRMMVVNSTQLPHAKDVEMNHTDYYIHCIEECPEYKKLGLIRESLGCGGKFFNANIKPHHKCM